MSDQVFTGKLKFVDIEGGVWYLVTESATYFLDTSKIPHMELKNGHSMSFVGNAISAPFGISMTGNDLLVVDSVQ